MGFSKQGKKYQQIKDVGRTRGSVTIKAKISRSWVPRNPHNHQQVFGYDMILIDQKGDQIHAVVPKDLMTKYQEDLKEGNVYEISNFDIEKNTQDYRPVAHTYKIKFKSETNITEIDNDESIPRYNFNFCDLATGLQKLGQRTWLMDFIGFLTDVGANSTTRNQKPYKNIKILDTSGKEYIITLWGDAMNQITKEGVPKTKNNVVIVTGLTTSLFNGTRGFSSSSTTRIFLNLNTKQVEDFVRRSTLEETETEFEEPKEEIIQTTEEIMQKNRVTIGELITLARNKTNKDELYTCEATIARIYDKKWSYTACPYCTKKMESNATECQNCKAFVKMPIEKYRYAMRVDDDTDNTTFVAFGTEAEYFLKDPVHKLMELRMQDDGEKLIKERLMKPLNEKHLFQIKFDKFSYQDGFGRSFTITHTFVEPKVECNTPEKEDETEETSEETPPSSPPTKKMRKN